jgi:hypothetical protein
MSFGVGLLIGFTELVAVALLFIGAPIIGVLLVEHKVWLGFAIFVWIIGLILVGLRFERLKNK